MESEFRSGYVAIVGEPNVGKSTLMNALLGQKISIVARKPQTTRQRILGICSDDQSQIIFVDTPGFLQPRYLLHEKMMMQIELALSEADVIVALTEVSKGADLPHRLQQEIQKRGKGSPVVLVINKVDTVHKPTLLPLIEKASKSGQFKEIVPLSALKHDNLDALLRILRRLMPVHPPFYPVDTVSERPERFFVAELVREKVFEQFRDEIPYSTAVEIQEFRERETGGA